MLRPGAELTRLYVKKTGPEPFIDVTPHFSVDPCVNERLTLQEFARKTINAISLVLHQFSDPPPSVQAITGSPPPRPQA